VKSAYLGAVVRRLSHAVGGKQGHTDAELIEQFEGLRDIQGFRRQLLQIVVGALVGKKTPGKRLSATAPNRTSSW
jgi:hypothetical protein